MSQVRATRALLAGLGTAGSLVGGAAILFVLASAIVSFDGWPQISAGSTRTPVIIGSPVRQRQPQVAARVVAAFRATAPISATGPAAAAPRATGRTAVGRFVPSTLGTPATELAGGSGPSTGTASTPLSDGCSADCVVSPPATGVSAGVGAATGVVGGAVSTTGTALGSTVTTVAKTLAGGISHVSSSLGTAVQGAGQAVGGTVTATGRALGSTIGATGQQLSGLLPRPTNQPTSRAFGR